VNLSSFTVIGAEVMIRIKTLIKTIYEVYEYITHPQEIKDGRTIFNILTASLLENSYKTLLSVSNPDPSRCS
jgi:hypothetical protein